MHVLRGSVSTRSIVGSFVGVFGNYALLHYVIIPQSFAVSVVLKRMRACLHQTMGGKMACQEGSKPPSLHQSRSLFCHFCLNSVVEHGGRGSGSVAAFLVVISKTFFAPNMQIVMLACPFFGNGGTRNVPKFCNVN